METSSVNTLRMHCVASGGGGQIEPSSQNRQASEGPRADRPTVTHTLVASS